MVMQATAPRTDSAPVASDAATIAGVQNASATAVVFELKDGKHAPGGAVGYADDHVEFAKP